MRRAAAFVPHPFLVAALALLLVALVTMHGSSGAAAADLPASPLVTLSASAAAQSAGGSIGHGMARTADARCDERDGRSHAPMHTCAASPCSMALGGKAPSTCHTAPGHPEVGALVAPLRVRRAWVADPPVRALSPLLLSISRT